MRRAVAVLAVVAALACAGGANAKTTLTYVALGDSVAAGYGLGSDTTTCARSATRSYPARVERGLERRHERVRFVSLACSGATAAAGTGPRSLSVQVDAALRTIGGRDALVSLTVGINDLEWWNLFRLSKILRGDRAAYDAWVDDTVGAVRVAVRLQLVRLLAGPHTEVVLTGYYDPINRGSPLYALCPDADLCRARVGEAVRRLNGAIRRSSAGLGPRVRLAEIWSSFIGHEGARPRCGTAPPDVAATWVQEDCLHPNDSGAAAIAGAVLRAAARLGL